MTRRRGFRALALLLRLRSALSCSDRLARTHFKKNRYASCAHAAFFRSTMRSTGPAGGSRDVPSGFLGGRNASFFAPHRCCDVSIAQNARFAFRIAKTNTKSTSARSRVFRKRFENRSAAVLASVRRCERIPGHLQSVSRASLARSRSVPGRFWGTLGSPGAASERLRTVFGASPAHPSASRCAPGTPPIAQERPRGDLGAFRARFLRVRRASGSLPVRLSQRVFRRRWCACSRYDRSASGQPNVMPSELFRVRPRVIACFVLPLLRSTPPTRRPSFNSLHQGKCT